MPTLGGTPTHTRSVALTPEQEALRDRLVATVRVALRSEEEVQRSLERADSRYRAVAQVLVDLRHSFPGPDGELCDLRGRSAGYRLAVRSAYEAVGGFVGGPVPKRLTVGVSYWVRKMLIDQYGEEQLTRLGVLRGHLRVAHTGGSWVLESLPEHPTQCLHAIVGVLNALVIDPKVEPTEELVRAAQRAVVLLQRRLPSGARSA